MPKVSIYPDEWYPVLCVGRDVLDTGMVSYPSGFCDVSDEFLKEYERFMEHYESIQDRLRVYMKNGNIELVRSELRKYVDSDVALSIATKHADDVVRVMCRIEEKEKEIRYLVFKSRSALHGSTSDRDVAVTRMVGEWIVGSL